MFILRIWIEPREIENAPLQLRGEIEHIASGEKQYLKQLGDVSNIVASYLNIDLEVKRDTRSRMREWFRRWKLY